MTEARAVTCSATVTCGGCGRPMEMVGEEREDDGTEDGIPYGPMEFLGI